MHRFFLAIPARAGQSAEMRIYTFRTEPVTKAEFSGEFHVKQRNAAALILLAVRDPRGRVRDGRIRRGFSAADQPSTVETVVSRAVRNQDSGQRAQRKESVCAHSEGLQEARELFNQPLRGLPWQGRQRPIGNRPELLSQSSDLRCPRRRLIRRNPLHHPRTECGSRGAGLGTPHVGRGQQHRLENVLFVRAIRN